MADDPSASRLVCAGCGAPIDVENADRRGDAMRCRFCGAWTHVPGAPALPVPRGEVDRPSAIRLERTAYGVRLVRRWWSPLYVFLAFFCVVWNGILWMFYGVAGRGDAPFVVYLFPLLHVGVGLALAYATLAGFLNRTTVTAQRDGVLMVRHGPLPWPGKKDLPARDVAQLFVVEKVTPSKDGSPRRSYALLALTKDRRRVTLLKGIAMPIEHALYFEQELERGLSIRDTAVSGEVARA
jgi:hypothetical protein